ncbi:MAG: phospholipase D family protein [Dehalococcoidia bacterium]
MSKFLTTTGVSAEIEKIIRESRTELILVSPYLQINQNLRGLLQDRDHFGVNIKVLYGKSKLKSIEKKWLESQSHITLRFSENLHAKCFLNETEALITSMNLYEFSQVTNHEMGILISKESDSEVYEQIYAYIGELMRGSAADPSVVVQTGDVSRHTNTTHVEKKTKARKTKRKKSKTATPPPPTSQSRQGLAPLTQLGYSTSKSRTERWKILTEEAVPGLGEAEVTATIKRFITRAEASEKNFEDALVEWYHDLGRLNK